jgi:signal peptidase II
MDGYGVRDNEPMNPAEGDPTAPAQAGSGSTAPAAGPAVTVASDGSDSPARRPRRIWLFAVIAIAVLGLDILSKSLVAANLGHRAPIRLLGGAVYLVEARNSGAAFSVGTGATIALTVIAIAVIVVILRVASRMRSVGWAVALGLILGGALGNVVDRIFRSPGGGRGHVVDWISVFSSDGHVWPIFNAADSAVVCGAITAAIVALVGIDIDGTRRR